MPVFLFIPNHVVSRYLFGFPQHVTSYPPI